MAKKKKQQMSTDVAKAVWETYANLYKERWVRTLSSAVTNRDWDAVNKLGSEMLDFRFDFNRRNK